MNFFGHAAVASWYAAVPDRGRTALGAMLPDLETMSGARTTAVDDPIVDAGVALHHRTDAAFHRLPAVTGLMRELHARLAAAGVSRGAARAASHVGVELLLDGVLVGSADHRDAYLAALAIAPVPVRSAAPARLHHVLARLRDHGVPFDLARADAVTTRIVRMTADRPLLAARGDEPDRIRRVIGGFTTRIEVAASTVVGALAAALGEPAGS